MKRKWKRFFSPAALAAGLLSLSALASDTRRFELDSFQDFAQGEADGVEVVSSGEIRPGLGVEMHEVRADGIWSMAVSGGDLYLGTGNQGKLLVKRGAEIKEVFSGSHVAITRILVKGDQVWFSAMPGGVIYRRQKGGEVEKVAEVGEEYIWDMIFEGSDLVVATGPNGRVLRLSSEGGVKDTIETGEEHVMCLMQKDGRLLAGTSGRGLLIEIKDKSFKVLHDFEESEVRRLAWAGGLLVAGVNNEKGVMPSGSDGRQVFSREKNEEGNNENGGEDQDGPVIEVAPGPSPSGSGRVSGAVYAVMEEGGVRRLIDLPRLAITDLVSAGEVIYVATDQEGKVYSGRVNTSDYAVSFDLLPAKTLSLLVNDDGLAYIGTGSPGALAEVRRGLSPKSVYKSMALDARYPARWGKMDWQGESMVKVSTRSGNVDDPQVGWSEWKALTPGRPGAIKSPHARYLQVKIEWLSGRQDAVRSISIPYSIYNQPHYIERVQAEGAGEKGNANNGNPKSNPGPGDHKSEIKISWKVENPDDDPLLFRLYFQPEGAEQWIAIETIEPITKPTFSWNTTSVPDGWYRIKVMAEDSPANPPDGVLTDLSISERFLVDNHAPVIRALAIIGGKVSGKAADKVSAISGIEYAIDGGEWVVVAANDGVFDTRVENFEFEIPADIKPGGHLLAVRAWDRADNLTVEQKIFEK